MTAAQTVSAAGPAAAHPPGGPCVVVIFGASGDLTKRLLVPALYNLACEGLLPEQFAVAGMAMDELTTDAFREQMGRDIRSFHTRGQFDDAAWDQLCTRLHYTPGRFDDPGAFARLLELVRRLDAECHAGGNVLFYMATPPPLFGPISGQLAAAGFGAMAGWQRIIVEKPFGTDLASARELNRQLLEHWREEQVYRIDH